jgi:hypothetical protein
MLCTASSRALALVSANVTSSYTPLPLVKRSARGEPADTTTAHQQKTKPLIFIYFFDESRLFLKPFSPSSLQKLRH